MLKNLRLRPEALTLLVSVALLLFYNQPLWRHVAQIVPDPWLRVVFGLLVVLIFNLVLTLFSFRWVFKPLLTLVLLGSAGVLYFMTQYGVVVDIEMLRNVAETNVSEVRDLLTLKFAGFLLLFGVLPAGLLWHLQIGHRPLLRELLSKLLVTAACLVALGAIALSNYQALASLFRNHHELRLMVVPSNYLGASFSYLRTHFATADEPLRTIGTDARRAPAWQGHARKSLTVLVVGESARAANLGLLGYGRDTTPLLAKQQGLTAFTQMRSCGTETAVSVPCMFSNMTRSDYSYARAKSQEGLLDVLKHAGLAVRWRDNQSGCKGTCDRVAFEDMGNAKDPSLCADGECHDAILLDGLQGYIDNLKDDSVLVLHQMGSHGPAYYKRYPAAFERFTPVCRSATLSDCSRESIINAYDNTLVYTDYLLSSLIDLLRKNQDRVDTAMIYLSDHGESLGEYNLYLHGTPYAMAPDEQKHVGLLTWFSEGYQKDFGLDNACLGSQRDKPVSQDNLFHSMLGLLQIETGEYQRDLDLFAPCRRSAS